MSNGTSINSVLTALLKKFGLNALELERHTGVPSSTIYRLLKDDKVNPTVDVLKKLSSFFQITVSQLIGEEPIGCKQIPFVAGKEILAFLKLKPEDKLHYPAIPVEFPLNTKSFATVIRDELMEPFILHNSIVIIDPEREITNKDFILFIRKSHDEPQIRQVVKDGADLYLKILNPNFPIEVSQMKPPQEYSFVGVIVHYRTNLFNFNIPELIPNRVDTKVHEKK